MAFNIGLRVCGGIHHCWKTMEFCQMDGNQLGVDDFSLNPETFEDWWTNASFPISLICMLHVTE